MNEHPTETALQMLLKSQFEENCLSIDRSVIENYISLDGNKEWAFQQCSGLGWIPNSSSKNQPFGTMFPVEFFYQMCQFLFGDRYDLKTYSLGHFEHVIKSYYRFYIQIHSRVYKSTVE